MRKIELLSPAKNLECGLAAVNHGADAVYIGASQFGARASAGNSIEDIEQLIRYAHQYRTKVYVTLNTLLTDEQLTDVEKLIGQVYDAGADALIVQDMGILKMNLPPIALHASTQTDNRTVEKVKFLQNSGFSRVVLARELSLQEIKSIHSQTDVELEAFVHGALCVSYSGQCYMSEASCGRSANRGACAQFCRLPYDLLDAEKNVLIKNKHLLSLKDLNLSGSLEQMIDAGVSSFKIEGRLKDEQYVKNVTAYYRKKLDTILEGRSDVLKASSGKTTFSFEPDPVKSFNRGSSDYFLYERNKGLIQADTPKSFGEKIGEVSCTGRNYFQLVGDTVIHNGDGLCYIDQQESLQGFRVNSVDNGRIFPSEMPDLKKGTTIFRNHDAAFEKILNGKTSERKITVDIRFYEKDDLFFILIKDEDGISIESSFSYEKQPAQKPEAAFENIKTQLSKLGNTIYVAKDIHIELPEAYFFPNSILNEWRRQAIALLDEKREEDYIRTKRNEEQPCDYPEKTLSYLGNVTNKLSETFYRQHGVKEIEPGFEIKAVKDADLMFCKYCIKHEQGWCPKQKNFAKLKEPLFLRNNNQLYELHFDCKNCQMRISKA